MRHNNYDVFDDDDNNNINNIINYDRGGCSNIDMHVISTPWRSPKI